MKNARKCWVDKISLLYYFLFMLSILKILFIISILPTLIFAEENLFNANEHCVAWKTSKRMFLVSNSSPIGKNCGIETEALKIKSDFQLKGIVPVGKFDSGEPSRDSEVEIMLGGELHPNIIIESEPLSLGKLKQLLKEEQLVNGFLTVKGKKNPISIKIKALQTDKEIIYFGSMKTSFSSLGVEPISVVGGVVAKVQDELELLFQFQKSKIKGHP
jgi:hypothetical protein